MKLKLLIFLSFFAINFSEIKAQDYYFTSNYEHTRRVNKDIQLEPDSAVLWYLENRTFDLTEQYKYYYSGKKLIHSKIYNPNGNYSDSVKYDAQGRIIGEYTYYNNLRIFYNETQYNDSGLSTHIHAFLRDGFVINKTQEDSFKYEYNLDGKLSKINIYNFYVDNGNTYVNRSELIFEYNQSNYPINIEYSVFNADSGKYIKYSRMEDIQWELEGNSRFFNKRASAFKFFRYLNNVFEEYGYDSCIINNGKLMQRTSIRNNMLSSRNTYEYDSYGEIKKQIVEGEYWGQIDTAIEFTNTIIYSPSGEKLSEERISNNHFSGELNGFKFEYFYNTSGGGLSSKDINSKIAVFPNPANNYIKLDFSNSIDQMEIINIEGKKIKSVNSSDNLIDISDLKPGVYIVQIYSGDQKYQSKFVKQ